MNFSTPNLPGGKYPDGILSVGCLISSSGKALSNLIRGFPITMQGLVMFKEQLHLFKLLKVPNSKLTDP